MSRIFISYKRVDKDKVFKIKDQIESALGEKCWIDLDGIESDAQFANVIINAINECEIVLFMYSRTHGKIKDFEKDWTVRELNFAQTKNKRIVFINLDGSSLTDAFSFSYGTKQQVDATSSESIYKLIFDLSKWLNLSNINTSIPKEKHHCLKFHISQMKLFGILLTIVICFAVSLCVVLNSEENPTFHRIQSWKNRYNIFRKELKWGKISHKELSDGKLIDGYAAVDLGLSVKWATCNIGAIYPYDWGDFFAWGEVKPKDNYSIYTSSIGHEDYLQILPDTCDAASVIWNKGWRMPTYDECVELKENCIFETKVFNGRIGSKVTGPNGACIFIPFSGDISKTKVDGQGAYFVLWTSSFYKNDSLKAYEFAMSIKNDIWYIGSRMTGHNIRPIHE